MEMMVDITNGKLTFSGDKEMEGGIYLIVLPRRPKKVGENP